MKSHNSAEQINQELWNAKLLWSEPGMLDDSFEKSRAGYLGEVDIQPAPGSPELLLVSLGIHTGSYCGFDNTSLLYEREPVRIAAQINAERSYSYGFQLRDLSVGELGVNGRRVIGSAWVISNCTSSWNGSVFRIDALRGNSLTHLFERSAPAFFGPDNLSIRVTDETVTFDYKSGSHILFPIVHDATARYRVHKSSVTRLEPVAKSFGGFIDEWLYMDDLEATRWSSPEAARKHHATVAKFEKVPLNWRLAADCAAGREIAVATARSKQLTVFLIGGTALGNLKMLSVSDKLSPSCHELNMREGSAPIMSEPEQ